MTTVAILQSNYIPWRGYFDILRQADVFVLYDEVQFTKNDWRNRNQIVTRTGPLWLTIPTKTSGQWGQSIAETQIAHPSWARKHWASIQQAYARAPYYEQHRDWLGTLYTQAATQSALSTVNRSFLSATAGVLGLTTPIVSSSDIPGTGDQTGRLLQICQHLGATRYLSGAAAQTYLDTERFHVAGIRVDWMAYPAYPTYQQNDGVYRPSVSVLDTLMHRPCEACFDE